jgi:outer membrane autotransporter protein
MGAGVDVGWTGSIAASRMIQGSSGLVKTTSNYNATLVSEQISAGYDFNVMHQALLRPFVGFISQQALQGNITEQGNTGFELAINSSNYVSARSQLGTLLLIPVAASVKPFGALFWEHEFADQYSTFDAQFVGLGPTTFNIVGTAIGRDAAIIQGGFAVEKNNFWNIALSYAGRFTNAYNENGVQLQLNLNLG